VKDRHAALLILVGRRRGTLRVKGDITVVAIRLDQPGRPMRLTNKTALITGGNSGIGLATARLLAAEGARVAITGRNERTLAEVAESIGGDVVTARLDVADLAAIEPVLATLAERLGRLDVVFANAGIGGDTPVGNTPIALFEEIVRVNLTAVSSPCRRRYRTSRLAPRLF
jgi:NAD(P)-dependent dehydrogenase (short-subunit alcohol dehydrogenase family)